MKAKIKEISISLTSNEANNLEEELHSFIYALKGDFNERIKENPEMEKLRKLLIEHKNHYQKER